MILRERIIAAPKATSRTTGLGLVIAALLMHYYGTKSQFAHISVLSLVLLVWAVPFYLFGWQVAKLLIFPCAFLLFCVPLHFLDQLTFPLKMFATSGSTFVLQGLGVRVVQNGAKILFVDDPQFPGYSVEDACSGLRSLLALTAIAAVYAYLTQKSLWRKWALFLASIPIAIVGNVVRITTVVVVDQGFSRNLAGGLYHDYSTYFLFVISISLLVGVGGLLNASPREWIKKWKSIASDLTST
ncbi:MAG: exosortase/archaeosortase family protein [Kiritimatiellia bacterium]